MLFCVSHNSDSPPNYIEGGVTCFQHFVLNRHSGCNWLQAAVLHPFLIPRPKWQAPEEWKPSAFLGLLSLKLWARWELDSLEVLSTGLCPVMRHGDAECSLGLGVRAQEPKVPASKVKPT